MEEQENEWKRSNSNYTRLLQTTWNSPDRKYTPSIVKVTSIKDKIGTTNIATATTVTVPAYCSWSDTQVGKGCRTKIKYNYANLLQMTWDSSDHKYANDAVIRYSWPTCGNRSFSLLSTISIRTLNWTNSGMTTFGKRFSTAHIKLKSENKKIIFL